MSIDYDVRKEDTNAPADESLEDLKARAEPDPPALEADEGQLADSFELPGADLSSEELAVRVVPQRQDEFVCTSCFLVHHRSQVAHAARGQQVCSDCMA